MKISFNTTLIMDVIRAKIIAINKSNKLSLKVIFTDKEGNLAELGLRKKKYNSFNTLCILLIALGKRFTTLEKYLLLLSTQL